MGNSCLKSNWSDEEQDAFLLNICNGHKSMVEFYIQQGAPIKKGDKDGFTPLHLAASNGHVNIVELLLNHGARIQATDNDGRTVFDLAIENGHDQVVDSLLLHQRPTRDDSSAFLHLASKYGHVKVVTVLHKHGARMEEKDADGKTALHHASFYGHEKVVEFLLEQDVQVNELDKFNRIPLHLACENGHEKVAELLLSNGARIGAIDKFGKTPLHVSSFSGHVNMTNFLLRKRPPVNGKDIEGSTPLHLACKGMNRLKELETPLEIARKKAKDYKTVVELLLRSGAQTKVKDQRGKTPLQVAQESDDSSIVGILA